MSERVDDVSKRSTKWLVKDGEGQEIVILCKSWQVGVDGLRFYEHDNIIAWFASWQHFREIG